MLTHVDQPRLVDLVSFSGSAMFSPFFASQGIRAPRLRWRRVQLHQGPFVEEIGPNLSDGPFGNRKRGFIADYWDYLRYLGIRY